MMPIDCREQLVMYAAAHSSVEVCGFVLDDWTYLPVMNRAERATREFTFDPESQKKAMQWVNYTGRLIIGVFHSHPGGTLRPSEQDIKGWPISSNGDHCRYWIIALGRVNEWRMTDDGPVIAH